MRVTIVKDDNAVLVDGERHTVDCSALPADFHALQWDDATGGEVEYSITRCDHCGARTKKGNVVILHLTPPYQNLVDAWHVAHRAAAEFEAEVAAAQTKAAVEVPNATGPQG